MTTIPGLPLAGGRATAGGLALLLLAAVLPAAEPTALTVQADAAVRKGLKALVQLQRPDGLFSDSAGVSALAGMALLAGGHTPTRGDYAAASGRCLRAVIARQDPASGYLGTDLGHAGMYGHGFATLYLAEAAGMAGELPVRRALESAVDCIHRAQNGEGGWRYTPVPADADVSVTICQVMALRAAYNVGVGGDATVEAVRRAIGYVRRCQNADGSFAYQATGTGQGGSGAEGIPRTAAGVMSLVTAGISDASDQALAPAYDVLRRHWKAHLQGDGAQHFYWYGEYYLAQALHHSTDRQDWRNYWQAAVPALTAKQDASGLWLQGEGPAPVYPTAMALIILQIPVGALPILQR